ncbi:hypothetical protein A3K34_03810 [candidate division WWE3 bacterium RIFOXYC1_FULL_40_10]|uniref:Uncharacterized protein n=1 Tax=candidate division WWE3 bacterium RIFOXYA2_FULL_46_9 TaxID=1802636 RepID=A0A1F4W0V0_UNCKA|nr:MAG: hypothetical protein A3K58_03810 [candidate division WWE3 bacterium RIFOXYB1_FULL_40_22]OGC61966.1 MAG: hypothetical protein A3K37_03810 [candidate division WWE3 bacterium RIFOXYA1_FULL_40_11]OGC63049.1 MAG: hypothetical protein A2264_03875 [candidate division WWE3 bacterium RIFOXYA2_FULL_46_9]OGC64524.1 MAG: hypothetical protein A2326_03950 [candidate division WWE3 bacterium RIFOXYB2_FULL_41_6]OGC66349.1 MAG: hypothetical protein A3K34_03810 [candidate division WWE3 bacterium RIFOXYC1_
MEFNIHFPGFSVNGKDIQTITRVAFGERWKENDEFFGYFPEDDFPYLFAVVDFEGDPLVLEQNYTGFKVRMTKFEGDAPEVDSVLRSEWLLKHFNVCKTLTIQNFASAFRVSPNSLQLY